MADMLDAAYYEAFRSGAGNMVLDDMRAAYYDRPMFDTGSDFPDPGMALAFREGQRSVVLDILAAIRRGALGEDEGLPTTWQEPNDI